MVDDAPSMLATLAALAREAGAAILQHYGEGVTAAEKGDGSPITIADRESHRVIAAGLAALDGSIPVVSEEGEIPAYDARRSWDRFWLVDPLDGTKEFLARNGEFTVNIALIEGGTPALGVIFAPALDVLYYAGAGTGAWKQHGATPPERIFSNGRGHADALTVVESRSHPSPRLEEFVRTIRVERRVRVGSSLKFCWVAEGRADVYPRFGPTMEWDVAAGDCIYRNAARVSSNRSPLTYNTPDLRNDGFVIGL